jgi:hypothetical protein
LAETTQARFGVFHVTACLVDDYCVGPELTRLKATVAIIVIDLSPPGEDSAERLLRGKMARIACQEGKERLVVADLSRLHQVAILFLPFHPLFARESAQMTRKLLRQVLLKILRWQRDRRVSGSDVSVSWSRIRASPVAFVARSRSTISSWVLIVTVDVAPGGSVTFTVRVVGTFVGILG